jgi:ABC-type transporter MlaC component
MNWDVLVYFNFCRSKLIYAFALLCFFVPLVQGDEVDAKSSLRLQYEPIISLISKRLLDQHQSFKKDPKAYQSFLDQHVRPYWDTSSTARALVGGTQFKAFSPKAQHDFIQAVDKTLIRYAFEGIDFYSGQQFKLIDVAISDSGKMGWVQVVMESQILPDLNLDILVKRNKSGAWNAVDVRFKGITYVAVKKHQFKKILEKQGVGALIASLNEKNNKFFGELCGAKGKVDKQSC